MFIPDTNFYFNNISGHTYKFRITKMTRCYITIYAIDKIYDDIISNQRIKIRKDSDGIDYVEFKFDENINVNKVKIMSNKVNYTEEN